MFFGIFGKQKPGGINKEFTNVIYASDLAKENGVVKYAQENTDCIFIAWFKNTAVNFRNCFAENSIKEDRVIESKAFSAAKYQTQKIIFLEHFPLRAKEEALIQNCIQTEFVFFNSLTEPLFQYFGANKIAEQLYKMGFKADETIQNKMIDNSLKKAQLTIAEKVQFESNVSISQADWMLVNVGDKI